MSGSRELGCEARAAGPRAAHRDPSENRAQSPAAGRRQIHTAQEAHLMAVSALKNKAARLAMVTTTAGFMVGMAFLSGGQAHAIGGLCNGRPASHPRLGPSGPYGPALFAGAAHHHRIVRPPRGGPTHAPRG